MDELINRITSNPVNAMKWVVVFVVLVLSHIPCIKLSKRMDYFIGWEKKRDRALLKGHEITAKLVRGYKDYAVEGTVADRMAQGVYEYELNGELRKYRTHFQGRVSPPTVLKLYYLDNPRKVFSVEEYRWLDNLKALPGFFLAAMPWLIAAGVVILLRVEL
ncbi:MAG: hypothetical protein LUC60_01390 [Lachnospiraceae bacterium]|nr:hypothetical protein [Lachnospiraceae bacterium]